MCIICLCHQSCTSCSSRKRKPRLELQKLRRTNDTAKFTGFWAGNGNLSFQRKRRGSSEQWIRPTNRIKKMRAMRETSRQAGRSRAGSRRPLQIRHPCSRLKKRAKRVGDSEQVGKERRISTPKPGGAKQKGRNQETDRNDVSAADRLGDTTLCSPWNMETTARHGEKA